MLVLLHTYQNIPYHSIPYHSMAYHTITLHQNTLHTYINLYIYIKQNITSYINTIKYCRCKSPVTLHQTTKTSQLGGSSMNREWLITLVIASPRFVAYPMYTCAVANHLPSLNLIQTLPCFGGLDDQFPLRIFSGSNCYQQFLIPLYFQGQTVNFQLVISKSPKWVVGVMNGF